MLLLLDRRVEFGGARRRATITDRLEQMMVRVHRRVLLMNKMRWLLLLLLLDDQTVVRQALELVLIRHAVHPRFFGRARVEVLIATHHHFWAGHGHHTKTIGRKLSDLWRILICRHA